jgi:hypothetical protein
MFSYKTTLTRPQRTGNDELNFVGFVSRHGFRNDFDQHG